MALPTIHQDISCGQVIPRHRLQDLEQNIIGLYPNSLNRMRHPSSLYKAVPKGGGAPVTVDLTNDVHVARRNKPADCQVEMRVQMADADGAVLSGVNLNEGISMTIVYYCIMAFFLPLGDHSVYTTIWWLNGCTVRWR